jgi:hypothetical protein
LATILEISEELAGCLVGKSAAVYLAPSGRETRIYRKVSVVGLTGAFDQLCVLRITSPEVLRKGPKLPEKFGSLVIGEYNCRGRFSPRRGRFSPRSR